MASKKKVEKKIGSVYKINPEKPLGGDTLDVEENILKINGLLENLHEEVVVKSEKNDSCEKNDLSSICDDIERILLPDFSENVSEDVSEDLKTDKFNAISLSDDNDDSSDSNSENEGLDFSTKTWYSTEKIKMRELHSDSLKKEFERILEKKSLKLRFIGDKRERLKSLFVEFPHFKEVLIFIDNYLKIQEKGNKIFKFPNILLNGISGIGKTFFLKRLAETFGVDFLNENIPAISSNSRFTGTEKHWSNATIGVLLDTLLNWEYANGIVLLDELEKSNNYCGSDAVITPLLAVLEKETAKKFKDLALNLVFDASDMVFVASTNDVSKLPSPLKTRFKVFQIPAPNESERILLSQVIYKKILKDNEWENIFSSSLLEETVGRIVVDLDGGCLRKTKTLIEGSLSAAIDENKINEDGKIVLLPHHLQEIDDDEIRIGF